MNLDEVMKHLLWIVIFGVASFGIYRLFRGLGA
jgi:hypothetical protein